MKMREYLPAVLLLACWHANGKAQPKFPVISPAVQQERDADRKLILETELQEEQAALYKAQANYSREPDDVKREAVHRHEENIKALRRELGDGTSMRFARAPARISTTGRTITVTKIAPPRREAGKTAGDNRPSSPTDEASSSWVILVDAPFGGKQTTQTTSNASMATARAYPVRILQAPPEPASQRSESRDSGMGAEATQAAVMVHGEAPFVQIVN